MKGKKERKKERTVKITGERNARIQRGLMKSTTQMSFASLEKYLKRRWTLIATLVCISVLERRI